MNDGAARVRWRRWWPWGGALFAAAALVWVLRGFDLGRFLSIVTGADRGFLLLVPLAVIAEQLVRAWKWRQLLHPVRSIGTFRLFGAIMAGYLGGLIVPFGFAPLVRSWLVARREGLMMSAVLASVAVDRLIDGVIFAGFVAVALALVAFPDPTGGIRAGLTWGGAGTLVLFALLLFALSRYKLAAAVEGGTLERLLHRLPAPLAEPVHRLCRSFAAGIVWPRESWRGFAIVLGSVVMKLLAATHFLWSGLAVGVVLLPAEYVFLLAFLGFLVILAHVLRIAGGFIIGAVFALGVLGVSEEQAVAMALVVQGASLLSVAILGAAALWWHGVTLTELRTGGGYGGDGDKG